MSNAGDVYYCGESCAFYRDGGCAFLNALSKIAARLDMIEDFLCSLASKEE